MRYLVFFILCGQVITASIFFGAVHGWVWSMLLALSCVSFSIFWLDKTLKHSPFPLPASLTLVLLLFVLAMCLQLLNAGQGVAPLSTKLPSVLNELRVQTTFRTPISIYYAELELLRWLIPISAFILVPYVVKLKRDVYILIGCIIALAIFQGIYGIVQFLALDPFVFFQRPETEGVVHGTYINRNTYACLLAMATPLTLGCLVDLSQRRKRIRSRSNWRRKVQHYFIHNPRLPWMALLLFSGVILSIGVFLSLSRGGALCWFIGICCFLFLSQRKSFFRHRRWRTMVWCCILILLVSVYLYIIGISPLLDRFSHLPLTRWKLCWATWNIICRHWLFGVGGGCYPYALEIYKPAQLPELFRYAHNDYLQFIAEYGVVITCIFIIFIILWIKITWHGTNSTNDGLTGLKNGVAAAIVVIFCHAPVDYSLHILGHRLLCAVLMGIALAMTYNLEETLSK